MRLINRANQQSPLARQACDIALATHAERYGDYGRSKMKETEGLNKLNSPIPAD